MKIFCITVFLLGLFHGALAQEAEAERTFRTLTAMMPIKGLKYEVDGVVRDLDIRNELSDPYPLPRRKLEIFCDLPLDPKRKAQGRDPERHILATVDVSSFTDQMILFFLKDSSGRVRVVSYEDDYDVHRAGTIRIFNLSSMNAALQVRDEVYPVGVGEITYAPYETGPILVKVAVQGPEKWSIAYRKGRIAYSQMRAYAVIFDYEKDPKLKDPISSGSATVRVFTEMVPNEFLPQ
ncbi:MAG: hypothetical protein ACQKBT_05550 [Puniceicoccales bacterium]